MNLHRDIAEVTSRARRGDGEIRVGNVTRVSTRGTLAWVTVHGRDMWTTETGLAVGDRVAYWDGRTPVVVGALAAAGAEAVYEYPNWTGVTIDVVEGDDLQTALNDAALYDRVAPDGDHSDDGTVVTIPRDVDLKGSGVGSCTLPRLKTTATSGNLWMRHAEIRRDTAVTGTGFYGFESGALLERFRFHDLKVTGHGLTEGFLLRSNYVNDRGVIHNVEITDIENRGMVAHCHNLRTWGLHIHNLFRQADVNSGDVDCMRIFGQGHHHSGWWFQLATLDSISTESGGGSWSAPHTDAWQTYSSAYPGGGYWGLSGIIEDGVAYFPQGDQLTVLQTTSGATNLVDGVQFNRVKAVGQSSALAIVGGGSNVGYDECEFWLPEPSPTTYRAAEWSTGLGAGTNPGASMTNCTVWRHSTSQALYYSPESITDEGNTLLVGSPDNLSEWTTVTLERPTEAEVETWLTAA